MHKFLKYEFLDTWDNINLLTLNAIGGPDSKPRHHDTITESSFRKYVDGITMFQQPKIITDLFSVYQSCLGRSVLVKP